MSGELYNLSAAELDRAARGGSVVPLVREVPADLVTPVGVFLSLAADRSRSFLLESAAGGETTGRWSFLGWDPAFTLRAGRGWARRHQHEDSRALPPGAPLELLRQELAAYRPAPVPGVPPFAGGLVGYLAYDAVRWFEQLPGGGPGGEQPWYEFSLYERLVAVDHLKHRVLVVANLVPDRSSLEQELHQAKQWSEHVAHTLLHPVLGQTEPGFRASGAEGELRSLTRRDDFLDGVETIKRHIVDGDIFQGVLSQRFVRSLHASPFAVYRALRRINPSPYLFFLKCDETLSLAGSSPEMLVRYADGRLETHPIAGTRPRGADQADDRALERELRDDPKENAEHVMLVDLGRNDLGRVAVPGSVRVDRYAEVERYSHVMHLVSRVTGALRPGLDALSALAAAFPAGTVTGAPKLRAMEILDELEPVARGPYAGAVAYLDFAGNLDSCIAIRTLIAREGRAEVQAGAGVVADSVPEREYQETRAKAGALMEAVHRAEQVLE